MAGKSAQERIEIIDAKIAKKNDEIKKLEAQKQRILHPVNMKTVLTKAKEAGLSAEEIAKRQAVKFCVSEIRQSQELAL